MQKNIIVEGLDTPVILTRRKGSRSLRISLKNDGTVRVNVPYGVPEFAARNFVRSKVEWIKSNLKPVTIIRSGVHVGKSHRLTIETSTANRHSTKITDTEIKVRLPDHFVAESPEAQKIVKKACEKALLRESETLLPQRLEYIAEKQGIKYKSCTIKKLKSRWGACDNYKNITLNSFLIQLSWDLIDYVIYHELAHIKHAHHQKEFWDLVESMLPGYKPLKKRLKTRPTDIVPTTF